jgi:hypothetical protein
MLLIVPTTPTMVNLGLSGAALDLPAERGRRRNTLRQILVDDADGRRFDGVAVVEEPSGDN